MKKSYLLAATSLLALAAFKPAWAAQPQTASADEVEEITVSSSRITISGYEQPTPVTVVGMDQLMREAPVDIGSAIAKLPALGAAASPHTSNGSQTISAGAAGQSLVNLRDLGVSRTLVLFDGVRVVPSNQGGGADLNLFPSVLVQRIDVVTGGASAAWGSDAVSGVVNVIMNKNFTGFSAHAEGATNQRGTRRTGKLEGAWGGDFLGGKLHTILSGGYLKSPDVVVPQQTAWYKAANLMPNPLYTPTNGLPRLVHATNVGLSSATRGGLITGGPLKGIQFVGPNGTPAPFNYGVVSGVLNWGGTFESPVMSGQANNLAVPIQSETFVGYASYEINDQMNFSLEIDHGHTKTTNGSASYTRQGNITIKSDNAYLDPTIVARMQTAGIASFPLGTTNVNNCDPTRGDNFTDENCLGNLKDDVHRWMLREVGKLDGKFDAGGSEWNWDANLQHSKVHRFTKVVVDPVVAKYNLAIDAVRVTAANVGASGLPVGQIVCRSTLTAPTNGCQPLNLFGYGVASPAAISYINSSPAETDLFLEQYSGGFALQATPFSLFAGPVAVALGGEFRRESVLQTADPVSYARGNAAGNFQFQDNHFWVKEGFLEVNVPLIRDGVVREADFSAAGRATDYSTSGYVTTWKFGLTSQLIDDIKLRTTYSADIRAPTLTDLYNPGSTSIQVVSDPFRPGSPATNIFARGDGNPNLKPERAKTFSAGVVLTPQFLPGLGVSVDYYNIDIKGAIASPGYAYVLAQCFAGVQTQIYCPLIIRDANGIITTINGSPVNAAHNKTDGIDFQVDYSLPLFNGTLNLAVLGNWTHDTMLDSLGTVTHSAGSLNRDPDAGNGLPKLRGNITATYSEDRFSTSLQGRYLGSALLNRKWGPLDVDDNTVPAMIFWDVRGSYYLDEDHTYQAYLAIDNVMDSRPPNVPHSSAAAIPYFYSATRTEIYDALGRSYRFGVRAKF